MIDPNLGGFWTVTFGQLLTAVAVAVAWIITKAQDWRTYGDKIKQHTEWIREHKEEADKRDVLISQLTNNSTRLTALQESTEWRLRQIERRGT